MTRTLRTASKSSIKDKIVNRVHILQWLPKYSRSDIVADLIAGISVGLTMMPQSIAYAGLAGLPAQYGLYTAFIGSLTYVFFGTIKQVSIGPTSLMSILTFTYVEGYPIDYVILLTFLAGCVELTMGILKLGFLVDFISPCVSSGFTSSTSVIIIAAQLKNFFGLKIKSHSFMELVRKICENIPNIKMGDTLLGISCMVVLFGFKQLTKIKTRNFALKKALWFLSISKNAIVVLVASLVAYYLHEIKEIKSFALSGTVPQGLPAFKFPHFSSGTGNETVGFFDMVHSLGTGVIVVPVCAVLANVAIAKSFTAGIIVDASQEMMTLGLCNIFGSCVQAMPSCGAFSRSAVANSSGVRTPLQGIYSGSIIILALSFLTPYFYYIPKSTLAAVLIFAVSSMIEYEILPILWKTNKIDFFMNVITCGVGVFFGAENGIILGAVLNLVVLLKTWTRPRITTEIRASGKNQEYVYLKPELGLCYPGVDYFSEEVLKVHKSYEDLPIAIDCKNIVKIDYAGAKMLSSLVESYNQESTTLVLMNVNPEVFSVIRDFIENKKVHICQSSEGLCNKIFEYVSKEDEVEAPLLINNQLNALYNNRENERKQSIYDNV